MPPYADDGSVKYIITRFPEGKRNGDLAGYARARRVLLHAGGRAEPLAAAIAPPFGVLEALLLPFAYWLGRN